MFVDERTPLQLQFVFLFLAGGCSVMKSQRCFDAHRFFPSMFLQLNEMIRAPVEGDFWQVDHIQPVYRGGGQCSLENLQTLCTVCHKAVRAP